MSNSTVAKALEVYVHEINANYYTSLVGFTILYFDYLLTFSDEVRIYWGRRPTSATILFFVNRYLPIVGNVPVILQSFRSWDEDLAHSNARRCSALQKFHQFFSVFVQVIVGIIMILRTYALFERNARIGWIMALFASLVIAVGVWSIMGKTTPVTLSLDLSFMLGCHPLISTEDGNRLAGAWGGLLIFDSVIFTLTLYRAIGIWRLGTRRLFQVLIRDGTIYYLFLALANLSNILTFVLGYPLLKGVSTTFANAVSVAMVSRLMINLQNPALFEYNTRSQIGSVTTSTNLGPFLAVSGDMRDQTQTNRSFLSTVDFGGGYMTTPSSSGNESGTGTGSGSGTTRIGMASIATTIAHDTKVENEDVTFAGGDVDGHLRTGDFDDERYEDWDDRIPRRALWYNSEWVSGHRVEGSENELSPLEAARRDVV